VLGQRAGAKEGISLSLWLGILAPILSLNFFPPADEEG